MRGRSAGIVREIDLVTAADMSTPPSVRPSIDDVDLAPLDVALDQRGLAVARDHGGDLALRASARSCTTDSRADADRRVLARRLDDQRERQRHRRHVGRRRQAEPLPAWARPRARSTSFALCLCSASAKRQRRRAGVGDARVLEQHRQQRLEAGVAAERLAQVEHDVGRERRRSRAIAASQVVIDAQHVERRSRARQSRDHIFRGAANVCAEPFSGSCSLLLEVAVVTRPGRAACLRASRTNHSSDPFDISISRTNSMGRARSPRAQRDTRAAQRPSAPTRRRDASTCSGGTDRPVARSRRRSMSSAHASKPHGTITSNPRSAPDDVQREPVDRDAAVYVYAEGADLRPPPRPAFASHRQPSRRLAPPAGVDAQLAQHGRDRARHGRDVPDDAAAQPHDRIADQLARARDR